jgi:hypothetical protein
MGATVISLASLNTANAGTLIRPNHPLIRYDGRWDRTDSLRVRYSWPGTRITVKFTGTSVGVRLNDNTNYFNVYIDGKLHNIFHGRLSGESDYMLARGLNNGEHTLRFSRRNITFGDPYTFAGIILDSNAQLMPLPPPNPRKIEFIGDSFTAAESNESLKQDLPWEERFPVTNIDWGFAPRIARHFQAEYVTTCRSGSGMFCDWRGDRTGTIPARFDRALMESPMPKWDFTSWKPDVVVICLGLNDHSGLLDKNGNIFDDDANSFRMAYREFIDRIRWLYSGVRIVAVAAYPEWIRTNVSQVVTDEKAAGQKDVFYATFDEFPGGYVANGHPTIETHQKMADQIIKAMEEMKLFKAKQ